MKKADAILKNLGANLGDSLGQGAVPGQAPPGMSADDARRIPERLKGVSRTKAANDIETDRIDRDPGQPREEFEPEGLARLADSLKTKGQLQPVRVRWDEAAGKYLLIAGERRWRAAKLAGLKTLTCIVHEGAPEAGELLALQVVENALREDLRPIEQARAYRRLMDFHGWSTRQLAAELNLSQSAVVKAVALLELPEPVQERVEQGSLAPSLAYQIAQVDDSADQLALADRAAAERLTGDQVAEAVRARKAGRPPSEASGSGSKPAKGKVEIRLEDGTKITVNGPAAAAGPDAVAAALRRAARQHSPARRELAAEHDRAA